MTNSAMNIATRNTGKYAPPVDASTPAVWVRTENGWFRKKMSRIRANTTIARISAPTPMLLTIDSSRTPKALMTVVVTRVSRATKIDIDQGPTGAGDAGSNPAMLDSTSGTVIATAVTVSTPAQK